MEDQTSTPDPQKQKMKNLFKNLIIIGVVLTILGIVLMVVSLSISKNPNDAILIIGVCLLTFGISSLLGGLFPKIERFNMQVRKHIQEENKDTLTSMANTSADIHSEAVGKIAKTIHNEINNKPAKFCPHCGAPVKPNQKFCKYCGNQL